jgi:hypothetical protein
MNTVQEEKKGISTTYSCWEELEINNNALKALGWLIEGFDFNYVPTENFLGVGIGRIIEKYLQEQKRIVSEFAPELKEELEKEKDTVIKQ